MALDRGELRYSIKLTTGQTFRSLRTFKSELKESRAEFKAFRTELRLGGKDAAAAARGIQSVAGALNQVGASRQANQALAQQVREARRVRQAFGQVVSQLVQIRRELVALRKDARVAGQALTNSGERAERAGRRGASGFRRLRREVTATQGSADRLTGSFLRMGGIISTFIIAQGVITGIRSLIETSIEFNRTIERSELGIAAILIAVGEVRGALGETVSQAQQLTLAQAEARRQTQLLRRDALTTAATFEQLLDVFQIALAPGLTAGLDVDEVRRFALRISQAALALGVAQNQLSEEIRSILSGTIRPQTTRIAVALGITNEDIKRVRELGQLNEFLVERFSAFGEAGEKALTTIDGLVGRVRDGLSQLAGEAGRSVGFFDQVKDSLRDLLDLFLDFDEFGFPQPDAQTLEVLQIFFRTISEGFALLREQLSGITFEEARNAAVLFGQAIFTTVQIVIGAIQGLTDGFRILGELIREVAEALGFADSETSIREVTRALVSVLVVLVSLRAAFGLIFGLLGPIVGSAQLLAVVLRSLPPVVSRLAAGFLAVAAGVSLLTNALTGIDLSFAETVDVIFLTFRELFDRIRLTGKLSFETLANAVLTIFNGVFRFIARGLSTLFGPAVAEIAAQLQRVGVISEESRVAVQNLVDAVQQGASQGPITLFDTTQTTKELLDALDASEKRFAELEKRNRERLESQRSAEESLQRARTAGIRSQQQASETLLQTIERVTAQFSTARTSIGQVQESSDRLRKALESLDFQAQFEIDPNVTGVAAQIAKTAQQEQVKLATELRLIRIRELETLKAVGAAEKAREASARTLNSLSERQQQIIRGVDRSILQIIQLRRDEESIITRAAVARAEERSAVERGAQEEVAAARARRTGLEAQLQAIRQQRDDLQKNVNLVQEQGLLDADTLKFLQERLQVLSKEAGLKNDLKTLTDEINRLTASSLQLQRRQAELAARRGVNDALAQTVQLRIQAELLRDINAIESRVGASGAALRLRQLQAQTQELQLQNQQERLKLLLQVQSLDQTIKRTQANRETNPELFTQRDALANQVGLLDQINAREEERLNREKERARILAEGTFGESVQLGAEDFIEQVGTLQEQLAALTTNLLQTFSQGLTNAIVTSLVNAFDEEGRFATDLFLENLQQAAGQLLQSIAQQLLQTVIDSLISTLLQSIITTSVVQTTAATQAAAIEQTSAQLAATTKITAASTAASIEIAAAQTAAAIRAAGSAAGAGFAGGGFVGSNLPRVTPPPGVARSDTVNAYLTPGEFVQTVGAVKHYGVEVMQALRNRMIDPSLLKGLAGIKSVRRFQAASRGPGFQDGGTVSENIRQVASNLEAQAGDVVAADTPPAVAFPVNDSTFETMLNSGKGAFRRFLRDNAADFDGVLRGSRTGG